MEPNHSTTPFASKKEKKIVQILICSHEKQSKHNEN